LGIIYATISILLGRGYADSSANYIEKFYNIGLWYQLYETLFGLIYAAIDICPMIFTGVMLIVGKITLKKLYYISLWYQFYETFFGVCV
jgi:hypothetical protein